MSRPKKRLSRAGWSVVRGNYQRSADRGRFPQEEVDIRMARLTGVLDMAALADCDLVIEAVFEDMGLKKRFSPISIKSAKTCNFGDQYIGLEY